MKSLKLTIASLAILVTISGCKKTFDQDVVDRNLPLTGITPSLLLPNIEADMFVAPFGDEEKAGQYTAINYTYYGSNQYWTGSASLNYTTLNNVVAMETQAGALSGTLSKPYLALAKFFKAYYFVQMSLKVGDLPMSKALQGIKNPTPAYDTQKQIFINSLALLDSANTALGQMNAVNAITSGTYSIPAKYDTYYAGDLTQWQKAVNTFTLRVLIELSKKAGDADLNVGGKFNTIVSNPTQYPIMTSMGDNLQHVYDGVFSIYPNSPLNYGNDATRDNMAATYLNTLASLNDLRALEVAEPARGLGFADTAYASFVGGASGQALSAMAQLVQQEKISLIGRKRYYETLTGENTFIISYPEMCFNIAEAINRGWTSGNAESWYKAGIQADQAFYGVHDGANNITFQAQYFGILYSDVSYTVQFNFNNYYNQPAVKYAGDGTTAGLNQILTQKYLALARNSGLEGYYQWRRTGVPTFDIGPGNTANGKIPLRYQYPVNERSANATNYNAAVASQFGTAGDDIYQSMWIIK